MSLPFTLKPYPTFDISGNDPGATLDHADPRPYAIIPRVAVARYPSLQMSYSCIDVMEDPIAIPTFADAERLSVLCGGYAYMLQGNMDEQIAKFISSAKKAGLLVGYNWQGRIPPIADVEVEVPARPRRLPKNYVAPYSGVKWANEVHQWLIEVERLTSTRPWIYTARPQWKWLLDDKGNPPYWTKLYYYWLKWYPYTIFINSNSRIPSSAYPTGVTEDMVVMWQYYANGRQSGYDYNDINTFTSVGLALLNNTPRPNVPDAPSAPNSIPMPIAVGTVATTLPLNVREGPGTSYPIQSRVYRDDTVTIIKKQQTGFDTWGQLMNGGWIALVYGGNQYVRFDS